MMKEVTIFMKLIVIITVSSIVMFLIGVFLGGNFFTDFEFLGTRGYEATGNLGILLGLVLGFILSLFYYQKVSTNNKQN